MFTGCREIVINTLVGSHNYNLNTPESDKDYKWFVLPTFEDLYKGRMFSNANQSDEIDYSIHDVRQLTNLLWKSNLNFIEVLFSTEKQYSTELSFLFEDGWRDKWATMNLPAFRNCVYGMHLQKMGELHKGTAKTDVLVAEFGYDTKQALHALRLLYVLERFVETQNMGASLWFDNDDPMRTVLLELKAGKYSEEYFMTLVQNWYATAHEKFDKFFKGTVANQELKNELDERMYNFIKARVCTTGVE